MYKQTMLLILAAFSAALFALPAVASAQELHLEGPTTFTGTGGPGSYASTGEPTYTCEAADITNGVINAGGTTGTYTLDLTGCHATLLGFTVKCRTTGSALDNTIAWGGTLHLITLSSGARGILLTPTTLEISCAGISNTHIEGNGVIGTITSPACGASSATMNVTFSATVSTQNHLEYTGVKYDLKARTSGGSQLTTGFNQSWTLTSNAAGKLNCT